LFATRLILANDLGKRQHFMRSRKTPAKLGEDSLYDYAVRALAARACSSEELRFRLRGRAARIGDVEPVIARLKEVGYLNDQRFAEMYAAMRVENDGFGRARVLHDLRGRRVAPKLAEATVTQAFGERDELEMVSAFVERRMPSVAGGDHKGDERKLAAAYRKLRRAGFSSGAVLTVLKRFAAHPELLEELPAEEEEPGLS
jgi:regulatory protein